MAQIEARVREDLRREVEARWQSKVADAEARAAREKERRVLAEAQASGAADAKRSLDELGNAMGELNELSAQAAQQVNSYIHIDCVIPDLSTTSTHSPRLVFGNNTNDKNSSHGQHTIDFFKTSRSSPIPPLSSLITGSRREAASETAQSRSEPGESETRRVRSGQSGRHGKGSGFRSGVREGTAGRSRSQPGRAARQERKRDARRSGA